MLDRRTVLRASIPVLGTAGSGCLIFPLNKPDIEIGNWTESEQTYRLTVVHLQSEDTTIDVQKTLPPDEAEIYRDGVREDQGTHRVKIDIVNGPSGTEKWSQEEEHQVLGIGIHKDKIRFGKSIQD